MSTASHTIFVANSGKQEIADTICEGETYEQYGFSATETGDYTNTIANDTCTTDVVLHLTVAPKYKNEFKDEICQGEYYGKNGFSLTPFAKGEVHDTLTFLSNLGCDSMVILNLNVKPITYDTLFTRICQNEVYKDNDFDIQAYQQCGLSYYTVEKTGENGCKNYYTLALQVDSTYKKTIVDKVFKDSTYTKYGYNLEAVAEAGTYSFNLKTANGCDSIVTLKLEVLPTYKQTEEQTICEGTTYTWDGQILSAAGTYTDSLKTKDWGDSIRTLTLTILPSINTNLDVSICNGSNYTFGSKSLTEAGTYTDTLTATNGCDSIVTLNLSILPKYDTKEEQAICEGTTYTWGGQTLSEAGTYTDSLKTKDGCDSVRTLVLSIVPSKHSDLTASICPNSSYSFGGKVLTEAGTYTDTLTAVTGCDSIVTLKLSILPTYNQVEEVSICTGSTYTWEGQTLSTAGTYTDTLKTKDGCDSIRTLKLTILPSINTNLDVSICNGSSYTFNSKTLTEAGTYTDTLTAVTGCDSIVTLNLILLPNYDQKEEHAICEGSTFTWGGQTLSEAGTYTDTLKTKDGCDSVRTLILSILPSKQSELTASICPNSSYSFGGKVLTEAGTYTDTLTAASGCDSIVTLKLSILPTYNQVEEVSICTGSTYTWEGQTLSTAGTYTDTLKTKDGCDSIRTLKLTILPSINTNLDVSICNGSSYTFGSKTLTEAGTYTDTLTAVGGCDSIVTLNLSILPKYDTKEEHAICEGSTFTWGGQTLSEAGTYTDTLKTKDGCDSVRTLILSILPSKQSELTANICQNSSYSFGGKVLTEAGTYTDTLTAVGGCDSIVTLKLTVSTVLHTIITDTTFKNYGYLFGDRRLYEPGTYTDTLVSVAGCDSIVTLNLYHKDHKTFTYNYDLCNEMKGHEGEDYPLIVHKTIQDTVENFSDDSDPYEIEIKQITYHNTKYVTLTDSICRGEQYVFGNQTLKQAGTYYDTIRSSCKCCDSLITTLHLNLIKTATNEISDTVCEGRSYTFGDESKTYDAGTYHLSVTEPSANGCDSTTLLTLNVLPSIRTQMWDAITVGESYNNYGFNVAEQYKTGTYTYSQTITGDEHCDSIITLNLVVNPMVDNKEIPTVFSPSNHDGVNDVFMEGYDVFIYDRYGNLICESDNGWDGKYRGKYADPGVYVYVVTLKDGQKKKGTIEVLKD